MIFNFPKEEIYLKKNSTLKDKFYYDLSGLIIKAKGSQLNVYEIVQVRNQSAAQRIGLLDGDIILRINGIDADTYQYNEVNGVLNQRPGKRIRLEINRNGQVLKKTFKLEDPLVRPN